MMLKDEYDNYMRTFEENVKSVCSDAPRSVSAALIVLSGIKFRVGQILADLEVEYANNFSKEKAGEVTDKLAKSRAEILILENHGISKAHFEKMHKDIETLVQSMKKRLTVLESEERNFV
jgi:serine kinase of HPr protein (carbohydrate metabolism regulator)